MSGERDHGRASGILRAVVNRRRVAALGAAAGLLRARGSEAAPPRPNIVLIVADDLDAATLDQALTVERDQFPNLNALREEGTSFSNFIVSTPLCTPSRATLLRGQYAHNHEVFDNAEPLGGFPKFRRRRAERSTVATWLQDAGYRTGLIGKYLNRYPVGAGPAYVPPGWDEWAVPLVKSGKKDTHFKYNYALNVNGSLARFGDKPRDYVTDVLARRAGSFIKKAKRLKKPFFLYLAPTSPHGPFDPAPRHAEEFAGVGAPRGASFHEQSDSKPDWVKRWPPLSDSIIAELDELQRRRLQLLLSVDDLVGRVLAALKATGALQNTFVVFASENGFHLGQHRLLAKRTPYDESIRVPLIVRGPGVPANRETDAIALNTDLAPTIAAWAGVDPPGFVDGRSLAPLLADNPPENWRTAGLVEIFRKSSQAAAFETRSEDNGFSLPTSTPAPPLRALRTRDTFYVEYASSGDDGRRERELYDMLDDPWQRHNLSEDVSEDVLDQLSARLAELTTCDGDRCRAAENAPVEWQQP